MSYQNFSQHPELLPHFLLKSSQSNTLKPTTNSLPQQPGEQPIKKIKLEHDTTPLLGTQDQQSQAQALNFLQLQQMLQQQNMSSNHFQQLPQTFQTQMNPNLMGFGTNSQMIPNFQGSMEQLFKMQMPNVQIDPQFVQQAQLMYQMMQNSNNKQQNEYQMQINAQQNMLAMMQQKSYQEALKTLQMQSQMAANINLQNALTTKEKSQDSPQSIDPVKTQQVSKIKVEAMHQPMKLEDDSLSTEKASEKVKLREKVSNQKKTKEKEQKKAQQKNKTTSKKHMSPKINSSSSASIIKTTNNQENIKKSKLTPPVSVSQSQAPQIQEEHVLRPVVKREREAKQRAQEKSQALRRETRSTKNPQASVTQEVDSNSIVIPEKMQKKNYDGYVMPISLEQQIPDQEHQYKFTRVSNEYQANIPQNTVKGESAKRREVKQVWNPNDSTTEQLEDFQTVLSNYMNAEIDNQMKIALLFKRFDFNTDRTLDNIRKNRRYYSKLLGIPPTIPPRKSRKSLEVEKQLKEQNNSIEPEQQNTADSLLQESSGIQQNQDPIVQEANNQ